MPAKRVNVMNKDMNAINKANLFIGKDYISDKEFIAVSKLMIYFLKSKEIYHYKKGSEFINEYVKHAISRLRNNSMLISIFLLTLGRIYIFISDIKNKEYLEKNGSNQKDILNLRRIIYKAIKDEKWKLCIIKELGCCNEKEYDNIVRVSRMCRIDIWDSVYSIANKDDCLNWRYFCYLIDLGKDNQINLALNIFLNKADIVDIKYPTIDCSEYISLLRLFNSKVEKSNTYDGIIDIGLSSNNGNLFINAINVIKRWEEPLNNRIDKERIKAILELKNLEEETKNELEKVYKEFEEQEGFDVRF
ncbi:hypothetical protein [Clostridium sp. LP20]|uniref:hypothetical protein n=1 Tax=Clostridium sp. LP20 TaxID=3418665 RepID=UPI003EE43433